MAYKTDQGQNNHSACPQEDVVEFCRKKGIIVTAYSPLGSDNSPLLTNEVVKKVADKHGVHPANILISLQANSQGVNGEDSGLLQE
jgi:glycerol 2-dehydrogenase (NADP+)